MSVPLRNALAIAFLSLAFSGCGEDKEEAFDTAAENIDTQDTAENETADDSDTETGMDTEDTDSDVEDTDTQDTDNQDTDTEDTDEPTQFYTATEGIWEGRNYVISEDGCKLEQLWGFNEDSIVLYEFEKDGGLYYWTGAGRLTWPCEQAEGTNEMTCEATAEIDFGPGRTLPDGSIIPAGLDAKLMLSGSASNTLTSDTTLTGNRSEWAGVCEGVDCAQAMAAAGISPNACTSTTESYEISLIAPADVQQPGEYLQQSFTWTQDSCNFANSMGIPGLSSTTHSLTSKLENGTFTGLEVVSNSSEMLSTYTCTPDAVNSLDWTCDTVVMQELPFQDATVTLNLQLTTRTASYTRFWAYPSLEATCSGPACPSLASQLGINGFPCSATGSTTANLIAE